jgi:hypothetical protein
MKIRKNCHILEAEVAESHLDHIKVSIKESAV